jgi:site-specific DNA-methyltransferase (adenine-specific)
MEEIIITQIVLDSEYQIRDHLEEWRIQEFESIYERLPPILLGRIDGQLKLLDGWHRHAAATRRGEMIMRANIIACDENTAYEIAGRANADVALPLKTKERKKFAEGMLKRFTERTNRWIAEDTGLSHHTIQVIREQLESVGQIAQLDEFVDRDGKFYQHKKEQPKAQTKPEKPPSPVKILNADSRELSNLDIEPVQLVITSPPYNVGIEYGNHNDAMPINEYLDLLSKVWEQCFNLMVDGARIAVIVPFGIGRNPWEPLACQVMDILTQNGFTLRGQIIWDKGTSGGRTSWGSFRLPSDPSLRDTTECIIVAHKGNSKLEIPDDVIQRDTEGSYSKLLESQEYFMQLAQDHWVVPPESATRVGHPAPFPVELVKRLVRFYAYPGAHLLDPFAGSGTVGVAAIELGCRATLIDIDDNYCKLAKERCDGEFSRRELSSVI